jgi:carboxymethylenebutenolidase
LIDTLRHLGTLPQFNGQAAVMGFCYGGPYAILGPKRLGYAAGICCHGSQMLDYLHELVGVREQVCLIWGDDDDRAPVEVLEAYRNLAASMENVEVHIFPRVRHGYMMRGSPSFDRATHDFSIKRTREMLEGLKSAVR